MVAGRQRPIVHTRGRVELPGKTVIALAAASARGALDRHPGARRAPLGLAMATVVVAAAIPGRGLLHRRRARRLTTETWIEPAAQPWDDERFPGVLVRPPGRASETGRL